MPVSPARVPGAVTMRANSVSMAGRAQFVTLPAGRIVQDPTGLSGLYDWEITYNPRLGVAPQPYIAPSTPSVSQTPLSAPPSEARR